jgi:hypothetical protein
MMVIAFLDAEILAAVPEPEPEPEHDIVDAVAVADNVFVVALWAV